MIRTFWHVALPAARPAAAMLALFTFVGAWTNFFWPFIVLGPQNPTLPGGAVSCCRRTTSRTTRSIMAGVLLATIPLLVLFVVAGTQLVTRHHARSGQGLSRRIDLGASPRAPSRSGSCSARHRRVPDRGRRRSRTAAPTRSGTRSAGSRAPSSNGDDGDVAVRPLPPLPRRRRAHGASWACRPTASRRRGRACARTAARRTRRASTSTRGWSTSCWRRHRAVADAVPLGPAAGTRRTGRLDRTATPR